MTMTSNEQLQEALIRHQIYLIRYSGSVRNQIYELLNRSEEAIAEKIRGYRLKGGLSTAVELERMLALQAAVKAIREKAWGEVKEFFDDQMNTLTYQEPIVMDAMAKAALPVTVATVLPSAPLLKTLVTKNPFEGRVMSDWIDTLRDDEVRRMRQAIQVGMVMGEPMDKIARRVVGTGSLKGSDGTTELTRRQVQAVTRTAVMHVSNWSRQAYLKENSSLFSKEQFVATLDSRTTPVCRAYDGQQYPIGTGPMPPLHYSCRSLRVAAFDDEIVSTRPANPTTEAILVKQYAKENYIDGVKSRDDLPYGTKGSYDAWARKKIRELVGPVPSTVSYQTFLEKQSPQFQAEVLGVTKSKLFRDGKLPLTKFVDANGNELTLKQLAQKYAKEFERAGLDATAFI